VAPSHDRQDDDNGMSLGPYESAPTDMENSFSVDNPDVAVNATGGVIVYSDYMEINYGDTDGFDIAYQLISANGQPLGVRMLAGRADSWGSQYPEWP